MSMQNNSPVKIERGTFQLMRDVENPKPFKRGKSWYHVASWAAGKRFIIDDRHIGKGETEVRLWPQGKNYDAISVHDPLFWLLVTNLEKVDEEPSDLLARLNREEMTAEVLDALFRHGAFTLDQIQEELDMLIHSQKEET